MRNINVKYICKDLAGDSFTLHTTLAELEHGNFSLESPKCGRVQEIIAREIGTGLQDDNGVEIYEGDVLRLSYSTSAGDDIVEVYWNEAMCAWYAKSADRLTYGLLVSIVSSAFGPIKVIIIGNADENYELMDPKYKPR